MTTEAAVRDRLRDDFGIQAVSLAPVLGGADFAATVWRATAADGTSYAAKVRGDEATAGLLATTCLAADGVAGIPAPLPARTGRPWSGYDGTQLSVAPWVPGRRGIDGGMDERAWRSLGALLGQVHAAGLPDPVARSLPVEEYDSTAASRARIVDTRIRRTTAGDDLTRAVVERWLAARDRIAAVASHTDELARDLRDRPTPHVVTHGDAHVGNVVVDDTGQAWLLDWDDVRLAPPERDLMFVLDWALGDLPVTDRERSWFFSGYGGAEVDAARLAYYRCVRTVEDIGDWTVRVLHQEVPRPEREEALATVRGLLSPGADVDRALSSLP